MLGDAGLVLGVLLGVGVATTRPPAGHHAPLVQLWVPSPCDGRVGACWFPIALWGLVLSWCSKHSPRAPWWSQRAGPADPPTCAACPPGLRGVQRRMHHYSSGGVRQVVRLAVPCRVYDNLAPYVKEADRAVLTSVLQVGVACRGLLLPLACRLLPMLRLLVWPALRGRHSSWSLQVRSQLLPTQLLCALRGCAAGKMRPDAVGQLAEEISLCLPKRRQISSIARRCCDTPCLQHTAVLTKSSCMPSAAFCAPGAVMWTL